MTSPKIPKRLEQLVRDRARQRCEYCHSSEWLTGQPCEIDHILPRARGGQTVEANLCLACSPCNAHKRDLTHAIDHEMGVSAPLFHPREHRWSDHFSWSQAGTHIIGLTPTGKVTIDVLQLNRPLVVAARAVWGGVGRHPPHE